MKKKTVAVICILVLLLTGCSSDFPELTDEEAAAIGEYAAITLLKYDANSRSRLVDLSQVEEEPVLESESQPEQQPESVVPEQPQEPEVQAPEVQKPSADNGNAGAAVDSIETFLEMPEGVSVSYADYELCQSYQEDDSLYFALEASEGKSLLVVKFMMQNSSAAAQEINLLERNDSYRLTVNGTYTRTALTTMLTGDMTTYKGNLAAGATEEVVVVIEVDAETAQNVQSISLNLKNESKTHTIQVL